MTSTPLPHGLTDEEHEALGAMIHRGKVEATQAQMNPTKETYLGDGLYASFDGWQFILRAPRAEGDHWVALEPEVLEQFNLYVKHIMETWNDR